MTCRTNHNIFHKRGRSASLILVATLTLLIAGYGLAMDNPVSSVLIRPGKGVADLQLNDPVPHNEKKRSEWVDIWKNRNVRIELNTANTLINRIAIRSPRYFIEGNRIGVYRSHISEVQKFYGSVSISNRAILSYPFYGVEFKYDPVTKKVLEIIIFPPERKKPIINTKTIKMIMDKMKQLK
jgi:hypothetical protein